MFSLVLPAYNEVDILEDTVERVRNVLKRLDEEFEIIIAEDGSTDGTDALAEELESRYEEVEHLHADEKLGRGRALKRAFRKAEGGKVGYIDVDLAVDPNYLPDLVRHAKQNDIVTGSRYLEESKVVRPSLRETVSKVYNWMIRFFLGCEVYDSQCGFKAFSKKFVENEIMDIEENSWAWDTVVIVQGIMNGYSYKEFPVEWKEMRETSHSASVERILSDIKLHGKVILKLFMRNRLGLNIEI